MVCSRDLTGDCQAMRVRSRVFDALKICEERRLRFCYDDILQRFNDKQLKGCVQHMLFYILRSSLIDLQIRPIQYIPKNQKTKYNSEMDRYELLQIIDQGAYGIVYKARNKDNNRLYAIKKFKDLSINPIVQRLITREITMLRNLKSRYIVEMREVLRKSGRTYIVFQYAGRNLLKSIEEGTLKQQDIVRITYQMLKGLAFMHSQNIMHRDIKPQNILIAEQKVKLCDFGFSRYEDPTSIMPTSYVATRWYRSPELLLRMNYGKPVDMWALGCLICEMIDGRPLFPGENQIDQLYLIQKTLGKMTNQQTEAFEKSKNYQGLRFPEFLPHNTIKQKFSSRVCKKMITLIQLCLKMNPKQRITPQQALCLPVFQSQRLQNITQVTNAHSVSDLHRKISSIYNTHTLPNANSQNNSNHSRRGTNSLAKIPSIQQYLSTDLHFRGREHSQSVKMNQMRDTVSRIYSKKLLMIGNRKPRLIE